MVEDFTLALYRHPTAFRQLGAIFYKVGAVGAILGLVARVGKLAASAGLGMAGQPPVTALEQMLPGVMTWWVPESFAGFLLCGLAIVGGLALAWAAKDAERQLKYL